MGYEQINPRIIDGIRRYADEHCPTGGFLRAVLENKCMEAVGLSDADNIRVLREITQYVYNEIPRDCWGSPEIVRKWLAARKQGA